MHSQTNTLHTTYKQMKYPKHSPMKLFCQSSNHRIQTFAKLAKHLEKNPHCSHRLVFKKVLTTVVGLQEIHIKGDIPMIILGTAHTAQFILP